jgi:hypothetical protein
VNRTAWGTLVLGLALLAAVAVFFVFGFRAFRFARHMVWQDQPIHAWMSVPFIAHTHHVPKEVLYSALGVAPREHDYRPLRVIARQQNRAVNDVIRDLEKAIAKEHGSAKAPGSAKEQGKAP